MAAAVVATRCPACHDGELETFFEMGSMPVHCNVLWDDPEQAREAPRGDILLGWCGCCGLIRNTRFDSSKLAYDADYESSLHFSARFRAYAAQLASRLLAEHDLNGADVIEIGCGKGDFLALLAAGGRNRCLGFDASYDGGQDGTPGLRVRREHFDPRRHRDRADLLVCRHVLEHIDDPGSFLEQLRPALKERAAGYFEVPDAAYTLRELGVWDVIYEHCSYFTAPALARLLTAHGLTPVTIRSDFGGQFLCAGVEAGGGPAADLPSPAVTQPWVMDFAKAFTEKVERWCHDLAKRLAAGRRIAVWGAGSKGVTFLNAMAEGRQVHAVVDLNPRKQGRFVPGTGQRIVAPRELAGIDTVCVMNPNYRGEIATRLAELGLAAELLTA